MTMGFLVSFGGVVLVFALLLAVEQLLIHRERRTSVVVRAPANDVVASLDRAELAIKEVEAELALAREQLRA